MIPAHAHNLHEGSVRLLLDRVRSLQQLDIVGDRPLVDLGLVFRILNGQGKIDQTAFNLIDGRVVLDRAHRSVELLIHRDLDDLHKKLLGVFVERVLVALLRHFREAAADGDRIAKCERASSRAHYAHLACILHIAARRGLAEFRSLNLQTIDSRADGHVTVEIDARRAAAVLQYAAALAERHDVVRELHHVADLQSQTVDRHLPLEGHVGETVDTREIVKLPHDLRAASHAGEVDALALQVVALRGVIQIRIVEARDTALVVAVFVEEVARVAVGLVDRVAESNLERVLHDVAHRDLRDRAAWPLVAHANDAAFDHRHGAGRLADANHCVPGVREVIEHAVVGEAGLDNLARSDKSWRDYGVPVLVVRPRVAIGGRVVLQRHRPATARVFDLGDLVA